MKRTVQRSGGAILGGLIVLASQSCSNDLTLGRRFWQDTFEQAEAVKVDVLFVVDNSTSMRLEQDNLVSGFTAFIENIEASNSNFQVGVVSTDMDADLGSGRLVEYQNYRYITSAMEVGLYRSVFEGMIGRLQTDLTATNGFEKGLWAAKAALYPHTDGGQSGDGGYNEGFLRSDAKLAIVFVSDEDDCSDEGNLLPGLDPSECVSDYEQLRSTYLYTSDFQALKSRDTDLLVSAIVGPAEADEDCQNSSNPGLRYLDVVENIGGKVGNICSPDFADIMSDLGLSASGIQSRFVLSRVPDLGTLEVQVDGVAVPATDHWNYSETDNSVTFLDTAVPSRGSVITFTYYPLS